MKYIVIHGIGNTKPGWSDNLYQYLDCAPENVIEVNWEDNFERSWLDKIQRWLFYRSPVSRALLDYGQDVLRYFADKRLRASVIDEVVMEMYLCNQPFKLIGFSLGSVIAMEAVEAAFMPDLYCDELITLGSPISKPVIRRLTRKPKELHIPWLNIWSDNDDVSDRVELKNIKIVNVASSTGHIIEGYIDALRPFLKASSKQS